MAKDATKSAASDREVALRDEAGADLGVTMRLGPEPAEPEPDDETGVKTLAARITGWSALKVDGEPYTFSKARALGLLQRFPWIGTQLATAGTTEDAA